LEVLVGASQRNELAVRAGDLAKGGRGMARAGREEGGNGLLGWMQLGVVSEAGVDVFVVEVTATGGYARAAVVAISWRGVCAVHTADVALGAGELDWALHPPR
jgi:hypothetical protein